MFRKWLALLFLSFAFIIGLSSCAPQSSPDHLVCSNNPYLEKYNCSVDEVEQAAEQGESDAQYTLGYMYYYGIGTVQDRATAILWIEKAANQGQAEAKEALALLGQARAQGTKVDIFTGQTASSTKTFSTRQNSSRQIAKYPTTCNSGKGFTIQMVGSHDIHDVDYFIQTNQLEGKVSVHRETLDGLPWYILAYGNYPSIYSAKDAIKNLPKSLRSLHPWVKSCKDFKKKK